MPTYQVIGIMSGTSMDGVDLAHCVFTGQDNAWRFEITAAETIAYDERWKIRLSELHKQQIFLYAKTDAFYGKYLGQLVNTFIKKHGLKTDLVSSHGHTVFHQPEGGFTGQIGNGANIHAETNLPVVCDFRTVDVALGGQGAPLVPIGDELLFSSYDACLNLGGIANISYKKEGRLKAFDISPCNIAFNRVAGWLSKKYDDGGAIAASGTVDDELLAALNDLDFYHLTTAKSLGQEWINSVFWPVVKQYPGISETNLMATLSAHIAEQINNTLNRTVAKQVLVTGGGAFNDHLVSRIKNKCSAEVVIPDHKLVNYKEALIFAFLGILRVKNQANCISSVTGSRRSSIGGALFGDFSKLA